MYCGGGFVRGCVLVPISRSMSSTSSLSESADLCPYDTEMLVVLTIPTSFLANDRRPLLAPVNIREPPMLLAAEDFFFSVCWCLIRRNRLVIPGRQAQITPAYSSMRDHKARSE